MELANELQQYNIVSDLDTIRAQNTLRQLLAIAPRCRSRLNSSMIQKNLRLWIFMMLSYVKT